MIGADTHKSNHTVAAVDAAIGRKLADRTVAARERGFDELVRRAVGWMAGACGRARTAVVCPGRWSAF